MNAAIEPDDLDAIAAEYVIGSLPADERAAFASLLPGDSGARAAVVRWEARLAPLGLIGAGVAPPPHVWGGIERSIAGRGRSSVVAFDDGLRRSRDRWRAATLATAGIAGALAAALVGFVVLRAPPAADETYVAAINRDGAKPALIVSVNLKSRRVLVRPVTAETPAGHSLELWYVGAGQAPRSLGLVGAGSTTLTMPQGTAPENAATLAISDEPEGGSKTGAPTGPVVYSGTLVRE